MHKEKLMLLNQVANLAIEHDILDPIDTRNLEDIIMNGYPEIAKQMGDIDYRKALEMSWEIRHQEEREKFDDGDHTESCQRAFTWGDNCDY